MSKIFIHIDQDDLTDELPGNKTMLYYLVRRMGMVRMSVDELAALFHVEERAIRRWLKDLIESDLLRREYKPGKQMVLHATNHATNTDKMSESIRTKCPNQSGQSTRINTDKMSESTIYKNNINNGVNNVEPHPPIEPPKSEYYGYIVEGMAAFYERRFRRPYMPNWPTQTTNAKDLSAKVDKMLQAEGIELNDQNRREWWSGFLERGYAAGDQYHRDNFDLDVINKQFNNLLNRIQNGKSRQRPADQDAEYLAKLQDILSR